eukprot:s1665_g3.t1
MQAEDDIELPFAFAFILVLSQLPAPHKGQLRPAQLHGGLPVLVLQQSRWLPLQGRRRFVSLPPPLPPPFEDMDMDTTEGTETARPPEVNVKGKEELVQKGKEADGEGRIPSCPL